MVVAWRNGKILHAFEPQLVPNSAEIIALVELNLVGDDARAILLVSRVAQVPACLALLHVFANGLTITISGTLFDGAPDLEVFDSIAIVVLGGTLPGNNEVSER